MAGIGCDFLGFLACGLVLCTFAMTSMRRLRIVAMGSNLSFIGYAWSLELWPILALHTILLPLNAIRLLQIGAVERVATSTPSVDQWMEERRPPDHMCVVPKSGR